MGSSVIVLDKAMDQPMEGPSPTSYQRRHKATKNYRMGIVLTVSDPFVNTIEL